nr:reverse transcriptase domain-containing protein [Tanacetum cinerariifolium]
MSGPVEHNLTPPTSAVRNTVGKENGQISKDPNRPASDTALREYCDKYYHQLLLLIAEKFHQEKMQQEKLKEVKARLNFERCSRRNSKVQEVSQHSESRIPKVRGEHQRRRRTGRSRRMSGSPERANVFSRIRRDRPESPRHMAGGKGKRGEGVFNRLGDRGHSVSAHSESRYQSYCSKRTKSVPKKRHHKRTYSRRPEVLFESSNKLFGHILYYVDIIRQFLENFLQQKKRIKDPIEIHHIKQREGESTEEFVQRFKAKSRHVKGSPECMRTSGFVHGITNPELIKRLHDNIPNSVDDMMRPKAAKKGETSEKDKAMAILMVQLWEKVARQKITQRFSPDREISFPPLGEDDGTEGPMIIEEEIGGHLIHRMYVDGESSSKILYKHCFKRLRPKVKNQMVSATTPLIGFSEEVIWPMGADIAAIKIGDAEHSASTWMNFVNDEIPGPRRSTYSTEQQDNPTGMHDGLRTESTPTNMIGVPRHIAEHRLNVREGYSPVRKKKRGHAPKRNKAIQEEVEKLVDADIIKEAHYHNWLSNPVMVRKHDDNWRMCVNFKDLNKEGMFLGYKVNTKGIKLIAELPTLTAPLEKEELIVYLATAQEVVSEVLIIEREAKQMPVYFVSRSMQGPEINYMSMDKPRTSVKGQILANFIVKLPEDDSSDTPIEVEEELPDPWTMFTDGSSCMDGPRAGLILTDPEGAEFTYDLRFNFDATNNEAKTAEIDMVQNDEALEINLDLLEETREQAAICEARSKAKMEKYYNSKVRNISFRPRDLVYRNNDASHAKDSEKLSLKWEGPYEVTKALGNGAYKLMHRNGKHLPRT